MFNKVPEQDPFAVSNEAEENIKLFPSFKVSVKFSLPYYDCCLHSFYHFYSPTYPSANLDSTRWTLYPYPGYGFNTMGIHKLREVKDTFLVPWAHRRLIKYYYSMYKVQVEFLHQEEFQDQAVLDQLY